MIETRPRVLCVPYARGRLYSIGSESVLVDFIYPIRSLELDPGPPATGTAAYPGRYTPGDTRGPRSYVGEQSDG
jgi:hypothetical protein